MFQIVFLALFAAVIAVAVRTHQRVAAAHGRQINQLRHELPALIVIRATLAIPFYGALLGWLLAPTYIAWSRMSLPVWARLSGAAVALAGVALLHAGMKALGANYVGGVALRETHELIVSGPYRWVRHPIYIAFPIIIFGAALVADNWLLGGAGLAITLSIALARAPAEERLLASRFGGAHQRYVRRTGRFFPRFSRSS